VIYQLSLDSGRLPQDWLSASVALAFKTQNYRFPANYQPISLTSVPCKILEHIIGHHIMSYFQEHKTLTPLNHGFKSGYSTETQLLTATNDLMIS
jgi:hypothetical protein